MSFSRLNTPSQLSIADTEEIRGTARWARTIAIIGFVMLGLMLVFGFLLGTYTTKMMAMSMAMTSGNTPFDSSIIGTMYTVMFVIVVLIYFLPTLFLYRYATRTLKALNGPFDGASFSAGLAAHRSFYSYMGVLMIIGLILNCFGLLVMLIAGVALGTMTGHAGV